jgi:flagellar biosynthesis anti-sigma factor FlgM
MKIDGTNPFSGAQGPTFSRSAGSDGTEFRDVDGTTSSDDTRLSTSKAVSTLVAQLKQLPDVRQERVAALRQAIQGGQYQVSDQRIADAVHAQLLGKGSSK